MLRLAESFQCLSVSLLLAGKHAARPSHNKQIKAKICNNKWVKSKETVGNSWTVLKVILGQNSISTDYSQNPQQKVSLFIYFCL